MSARRFRLVLVTATAVVLAVGGSAYRFAHDRFPGQSAQQIFSSWFMPNPQTVFGKNHLNVLVLGIDYNYDANDQPSSKDARSDTIMAIGLDFPRKTVSELSVPRDMDVVLPNGSEDKINAAYADGGVDEAKAVVAKFLGIQGFDRYVVLRVNATRDLIDAIGGVDVDVENSDALRHEGPNGPIDYDDSWGHLHVHLKPGVQHLDGAEAVGYARFRHDWCGDPCRILRQQQVMRATLDRLDHDKFNTLEHLQSLLAVAHRDIDTDFSYDQELTLAATFAGLNLSSVRTAQVPYSAEKDLPLAGDVIVADQARKAQLVAELLNPPANANVAPGALAAIDPASVHVTVENGSGERGLASKVAQALQSRGFVIDGIRDADSFDHQNTEIFARPGRPLVADKVRAELGFPAGSVVTASLTTSPSDVTVVVGRDYSPAALSSSK